MNTCIRGCLRPCQCPECKASDEPQHEPQPAQAEDKSLLCRRDGTRLYKWLTSVLDDTLRLDTRIPVDYGWEKESSHQKVTGSPALIRLDVAALTDRRSAFGVAHDPHAREAKDQPALYEENRDPQPPLDIQGEIGGWARILSEEQGLTAPIDTMNRSVGILIAWWDTIVLQPWVDDFYATMHEIRQQLDRALNVERPRPVGHCLSIITNEDETTKSCGKALYQDQYVTGQAVAKCSGCGRIYRGMDLIRARVVEQGKQVS